MNKVFLIGRLTREPELSKTSTGRDYVKFTLAVRDVRNSRVSHFLPCIAWQNQANFLTRYMKKGALIAIDGRLTSNQFTTKDGRNAVSYDVVVETISPLSSRNSTNETNDFTNYSATNNKSDEKMVSVDEALSNNPIGTLTENLENTLDQQSENESKKINNANIASDWLDDFKD